MSAEPENPRGSRYLTKAQFAAEAIRLRIRSGELRPGSRLDLDALGGQLDMSATPIREALRSLEAEGLVINAPHRGIHVAEFSPGDAAELYDLRAHLESYATRLAVARLTSAEVEDLESLATLHREALARDDTVAADRHNEEWHFTIYRASSRHTAQLVEFISRLWNVFPWTTAWMVRGRGQRSVHEHERIMAAIRSQDAEGAATMMAEHIVAGKQLVIEHLAEADERRPRGPSGPSAGRGGGAAGARPE